MPDLMLCLQFLGDDGVRTIAGVLASAVTGVGYSDGPREAVCVQFNQFPRCMKQIPAHPLHKTFRLQLSAGI